MYRLEAFIGKPLNRNTIQQIQVLRNHIEYECFAKRSIDINSIELLFRCDQAIETLTYSLQNLSRNYENFYK